MQIKEHRSRVNIFSSDADKMFLATGSSLKMLRHCYTISEGSIRTTQRLLTRKNQTPYLEDVFTRPDISDVDPLAVNIVTVGVPAANCDALLPHVVAGVALVETWKMNESKQKTFGDIKECILLVKSPVNAFWIDGNWKVVGQSFCHRIRMRLLLLVQLVS